MNLPPPGTRVAIYARYSTNMQAFKSIEDQVALCREYAGRLGWSIVDAYYDAERSGTTLVGRGGFFKMMAAADHGEFSVVLTEDLDRLSRTPSQTHGIVEELEALDINICTVSGGMVSDMEVAFKATQNSRYVKQLAEKTRRGQEGTVRSGRISGSIAYGYRKAFSPDGLNGYREICREEAAVVERIFKDYAAGVSTMAICKALNAEGVPGPRGKAWRPGALTGTKGASIGILRNRLYVGEFHWGRTVRKRLPKEGKVRQRATPESQRVMAKVDHLRILDDELFEAAQERLEARSAGDFSKHRHADYLFSRKVVCGVCGQPFAVLNKRLGCTGRALMGICDNSRRVPREEFEATVLDSFKSRLLTDSVLAACLSEYRAELDRAIIEQRGRAEAGATRLRDLDREIENILAQVKGGGAQGFAGQVLMQELDQLGAERQRLQREAKQAPRVTPSIVGTEEVVERLKGVIDGLRDALSGPQREAVRARDQIRGLIDKITVHPLPVAKEDGRGAGPVSLTVQGRLTELIDLVDAQVGRVILYGSGPRSGLDGSKFGFRYSFHFMYVDPRLQNGVLADLPVISRLLDDADAPVTRQEFLQALLKAGHLGPMGFEEVSERLRRALEYLKGRGDARSIMMGPERTGWVWNSIERDDEVWKARALNPPNAPFGIVRVGAVEAAVVVVGETATF